MTVRELKCRYCGAENVEVIDVDPKTNCVDLLCHDCGNVMDTEIDCGLPNAEIVERRKNRG